MDVEPLMKQLKIMRNRAKKVKYRFKGLTKEEREKIVYAWDSKPWMINKIAHEFKHSPCTIRRILRENGRI